MTSEEREAVILIFASRKRVYKILQDLWMNEPGETQLEELYDPSLGIALELLTPEGEVSLKDTLKTLHVSPSAFTDEYLKDVQAQYHHMINPPGKYPLPPFAMQYLNLSDDEKEEEMLMVRSTYERYGALHTAPSLEADSYLAMELSFMGRTCGLAQQAIELGIDRRAEQLMEEQEWFLNDHLLAWVPLWEKEIIQGGQAEFYRNLAAFTAQYLRCDSRGLADLQEII